MTSAKSPYSAKIKIFLDGADRPAILEYAGDARVSGFTTNPSLMKKSGVTDYPGFAKDIVGKLGGKPISFEVFADDLDGMLKQANEIATWGKNIYVKIPVTNSTGVSTAPIIRELTRRGVMLNVTAVFTLEQSWEMCEALKGGAPSLLSVFAGRIADSGRDPIPYMQASRAMCDSAGSQIELLWASTREVFNVVQAEQSGCHIITAPADILKKLGGINRELSALSLDTVKAFKSDSEAAGFKL